MRARPAARLWPTTWLPQPATRLWPTMWLPQPSQTRPAPRLLSSLPPKSHEPRHRPEHRQVPVFGARGAWPEPALHASPASRQDRPQRRSARRRREPVQRRHRAGHRFPDRDPHRPWAQRRALQEGHDDHHRPRQPGHASAGQAQRHAAEAEPAAGPTGQRPGHAHRPVLPSPGRHHDLRAHGLADTHAECPRRPRAPHRRRRGHELTGADAHPGRHVAAGDAHAGARVVGGVLLPRG